MEQENKKLEEAVAAGEGAKHSIEAEEGEEGHAEAQGSDAEKPQVIEMVRFSPPSFFRCDLFLVSQEWGLMLPFARIVFAELCARHDGKRELRLG